MKSEWGNRIREFDQNSLPADPTEYLNPRSDCAAANRYDHNTNSRDLSIF